MARALSARLQSRPRSRGKHLVETPQSTSMTDQPSKIRVVGGGAGGLELACKLGRKWGAERIALVDAKLFHIWKPSLHEVAAGTLDIHQEGLSYQMLAHDNGFSFLYGPMTRVDTGPRELVGGA